MPNVNTSLLDALARHNIYLERFSSSVVRDLLVMLVKSERAAKQVFDERLSRIIELGFDSGPVTSARTAKLISELGRAIEQVRLDESFKPFATELNKQLEEFAGYEAGFIARSHNDILEDALSDTPFAIAFEGVAAAQVWSAATSKPFTISPGKAARTLGSYLEGMSTAERQRIEDAVTTGVVNGETTQNIVRSVWGTVKERDNNSGSSSVITTRRGAEMLVRTAVNHIATVARDQVYRANGDLIKGIRYLSTLDSKTTPRCIELDNTLWPVNSGPRPPQHSNCRSTISPELKNYRELGINVDEPEKSTRAYFAIPEKMNVTQYRAKLKKDGLTKAQQDKIISSLSGQTDDPDFPSFLKRQTKEFQEKVLGKERTKLYREGSITLKELIQDGKFITLNELRQLHPDAFRKIE